MSAAHRLHLQLAPQVRGDCLPGGINEQRPCSYRECRWHLDRERRWPEKVVNASESCVLDAADHGGLTLEEVGDMLGMSRERVRQIEATALAKIIRRIV